VTSPLRRVSQPYGTRPDEQIHITGFTLMRFTTGQILEDDYSIAWYQLVPPELVELHMSRPQRGFTVAVQLARLLEVKRSPCGVLVLGRESSVGAEQLILANSLPVRVGSQIRSLQSNNKSKSSAFPHNPTLGPNFFCSASNALNL
jgi:hypothetical protein